MQLRACDDESTFGVAWEVLITQVEDDSIFIVMTITDNSVYRDSTHIHNGGFGTKNCLKPPLDDNQ